MGVKYQQSRTADTGLLCERERSERWFSDLLESSMRDTRLGYDE
jgi:hypothetical protein